MRLNIYGDEYEFTEESREYLFFQIFDVGDDLPDIHWDVAFLYLEECFELTSIHREIQLPGE